MSNEFNEILKIIYKKSPLQKKKFKKYLSKHDDCFFESADKFAKDYSSYLKSQNISLEYAVDAYLKMCNDMIKSQISFIRTDKYPLENAEQAFEIVYNNEKEMKSLMIGLAISQFLWFTHYKMYQFFLKNISIEKNNIINYYILRALKERILLFYTILR